MRQLGFDNSFFFILKYRNHVAINTIFISSQREGRRRRPFESLYVPSLSTAWLTESENYYPTSSVVIQGVKVNALDEKKVSGPLRFFGTRRSIYFEEAKQAIARRFHEMIKIYLRIRVKKKINTNVPANYHTNNLG